MKQLVPNYYVLEKSKKKSWLATFTYPFFVITWPFTFIIKRAITNVALGPDELRLQKPVHLIFLTDDRSENGTVIVNLVPGKANKEPQSYFTKMSPFAAKKKARQLSFANPKHKAYVDSMIDEIGHLLSGTSQQDKCLNKTFTIEDIQLKGLERLDEQLRNYFQKTVSQRFGQDFFDHPRFSSMNFFTLETADRARLESVEVSTEQEKSKPIEERKFLISCMARNQNYMYWLKDFHVSAKNIGCTVVSFNYRGLDYSTGRAWTHDDIVNDTLAQAQRLMELGVKPENIAFEGMSFGGAIATISAAKMHDNGFKVHLFNERSYRSLVRLMIGYIMPRSDSNPWNPLNWLKYLAVGLAYITVAPVIRLAGWHIDAASAWDRIPYTHKSYAVARNHKNPEQYDDDEFVHDSYSSIASLMDQRREEVKQKHKKGKELSVGEQKLLSDDGGSHDFTLDRSDKLNTISLPHSAPRRFMRDTARNEKTMHTYMIENLREQLNIRPAL
ncbi:alpha/beta hydrolase family protein [Legionella cardiaca]|uniref:Alpha/beta hydrolase n=1 Tax=Legionella cardiaca TaxID=1071983 RepID=A0ABY8AQK8_9GAMM|nr:alpha/beta hydrolase [Legionella cardiaca]WED42979.1 alpha/beta hydrolase [Legionella cardiaca]